jgi:hypothetical protein
LLHHQMHIQRQCRAAPTRLEDRQTNRDVWHERAVHHIKMRPGGPGLFDVVQFLTKLREIAGQQTGRDDRLEPGLGVWRLSHEFGDSKR